MIELEIRLYGAFRDYSDDPSIRVAVENGVGLDELRRSVLLKLEEMKPMLGAQDLLDRSVFADQTDILPQDRRLYGNQVLSLIPPVCGG